ncbi:DUF817 domain-containing protein [Catalinimonas niigatensis]|uniref:DUF817 domain-containing protein n=1 Tax=Catalinimonas niigatensis TaxID=1397264 RepID=UPI002665B974|nr:DUF817 domain-containing protein [Catalinimonas niigatensis]WPP49074.1 DUF817 domain-containing protein [Catalinimonas niigatensis]
MHFIKQLIDFGIQQALSCIFAVLIFATLALSKVVEIPGLYRYDFILIVCLLIQFLMIYSKLESWDELKVICLFHLIGLALELYKVQMGSWSYPEAAVSKIGGVPLYSGFMYASVASYICQVWRRLELRFMHWPPDYWTYPLALAIYLNFFTHHFLPDIRWWIIGALFLIFGRSYVRFTVKGEVYPIPTILSFLLIGFFIWIAENISTFFGAWQYPNQSQSWQWVHLSKISSWFLLVIISIIIVANLKQLKYGAAKKSLKKAY